MLVYYLGHFFSQIEMKEDLSWERERRWLEKMEALSATARGIAHDLNNVLTPILMNAEMALAQAPEGSLRTFLEQILEAAERAKKLLGHITAFGRQMQMERRPVEVAELLRGAIERIRPTLPPGIELREEIRSPGTVMADPPQIEKVLLDLAENAVQAMGEEGTLEISVEEVDPRSAPFPSMVPGPYFRIRVMDTGCGINPAVKDLVFDPYFTTRGADGRRGWGLSVAYGIVRNHEGALRIADQKGEGTIFDLFLPKMIQKPLEEPSPLPKGKERVLLLEEGGLLGVEGEMLQRLGYRVVGVTAPSEALGMLEGFDLLVADGELAKEIEGRIFKPVVFLCRFGEEVGGITVRKPVLLRELAEAVRRALGKSQEDSWRRS